jgi:PAS domain S-box-containing protein
MAPESNRNNNGGSPPVRPPGTPCVIIVEDEQIVARDLQAGLKATGYFVPQPSATAEEGLRDVERYQPDLVLLDIGLSGGTDGITLGCQIHARVDVPVVFATAYSDEKTLERAKEAKPAGYILKPYDVHEVRTVIEMAIYKHRADKAMRISEERYRLLFQQSPVGIVRYEANMVVTEVNDRFASILGRTQDSLLQAPISRIFDNAVHGILLCALRGEPGRWAGRLRRQQDKSEVSVMIRTAPLHDGGRHTVGAVAIVEDVTDQQRLEEALIRRIVLENLIAESTARLINAEEGKLVRELQHTLDAVGTFVEADRCFLDLFDSGRTSVETTHEWAAPGVTVRGATHRGTSLARWPWALERLQAGEQICVHSVVDLPPEASEDAKFWREEGARSLLLLPLASMHRLFGVFGIVVETHERLWPGEDLRLLGLLAELLGGVLGYDRTNAELQRSEERYRRITGEITDYIYSVQLQNGYWSETIHGPGCAAVTGYSPEDYRRDPHLWLKMVDDRDREMVMDQVKRVLAGEPAAPIEHRISRKDGTIRWVKNTPVLHFTTDGSLISYDGLVQDVTERREAEEALRTSEERYRLLVENLNDVIFVLDTHGHITYISQRIETLTGFTPGEIVGEHFSTFVHPDDRTGLEGSLEMALAGKANDHTFRILTKQGKDTRVRASSKVHMEEGKVVSITGIMTEWTEHRAPREGKSAPRKESTR